MSQMCPSPLKEGGRAWWADRNAQHTPKQAQAPADLISPYSCHPVKETGPPRHPTQFSYSLDTVTASLRLHLADGTSDVQLQGSTERLLDTFPNRETPKSCWRRRGKGYHHHTLTPITRHHQRTATQNCIRGWIWSFSLLCHLRYWKKSFFRCVYRNISVNYKSILWLK